jgi:2-keto-4-pentenoate hydratase/2-oxohepta-3-ene-1,7-dioic acid hydratase in catechol pathway
MKLLTYEFNKTEYWGFLLDMPDGSQRVFNPAEVSANLKYTIYPTASNWIVKPSFRSDWPATMSSFLALGDEGMNDLRALHDHVKKVLSGGFDAMPILLGSKKLSEVKLKAPIPRPRLYFGLVQNGPPFIRNNAGRTSTNIFPMGHNRPQGTVVGLDDIILIRDSSIWGFNVELGVVIGKIGRYIPVNRAMEYVAGFVPIMDVASDSFFNVVNGEHKGWETPEGTDWFQAATMSWCGKNADTLAPMGPYIVTPDEVSNVYDLICKNYTNDVLRERSYTGCYLIGVERFISWYSSFATLHPGDVLHLGTMGVDGLSGFKNLTYGPQDSISIEMEKIGRLSNRVVVESVNDWRSDEEPSKVIHPSPAVREMITTGKTEINKPQDWDISQIRHYWTVYGNYNDVKQVEGLEISNYPRILNTPASSVGNNSDTVEIPPRATMIDIGVELACVIKKVAFRVNRSNAAEYILGLTPLINLSDRSFKDSLIEPATPQEAGLPTVYGRWADKFNVVSDRLAVFDAKKLSSLKMSLNAGEFGSIKGCSDEYVLNFAQVLEFITKYVTLFPGDLLTLGRIGRTINVPAHELVTAGVKITAGIEGLGEISMIIKQESQRKPTLISKIATVVGETVKRK